jgi:hypothetical protein
MLLVSTVAIMALWLGLILLFDPDRFGRVETSSELQPATKARAANPRTHGE